MDIVLANPRGFCAGVDRAIEIVKRAIETLGAPIYVRHEVVHNRFVVEDLKQRGAVFVEELDEVPAGGTVIFSAHGVSQAVRADAEARGLRVFDATCPLVTKVHIEVARHCRAGRDVILIGHEGHPEVEGTMGQWRADGGAGRIYLVEDVEDALSLELAQPGNVGGIVEIFGRSDVGAQESQDRRPVLCCPAGVDQNVVLRPVRQVLRHAAEIDIALFERGEIGGIGQHGGGDRT